MSIIRLVITTGIISLTIINGYGLDANWCAEKFNYEGKMDLFRQDNNKGVLYDSSDKEVYRIHKENKGKPIINFLEEKNDEGNWIRNGAFYSETRSCHLTGRCTWQTTWTNGSSLVQGQMIRRSLLSGYKVIVGNDEYSMRDNFFTDKISFNPKKSNQPGNLPLGMVFLTNKSNIFVCIPVNKNSPEDKNTKAQIIMTAINMLIPFRQKTP